MPLHPSCYWHMKVDEGKREYSKPRECCKGHSYTQTHQLCHYTHLKRPNYAHKRRVKYCYNTPFLNKLNICQFNKYIISLSFANFLKCWMCTYLTLLCSNMESKTFSDDVLRSRSECFLCE